MCLCVCVCVCVCVCECAWWVCVCVCVSLPIIFWVIPDHWQLLYLHYRPLQVVADNFRLYFGLLLNVLGRCRWLLIFLIVLNRCGSLWIFCGSLWVVAGRCGSLRVVPCFRKYVHEVWLVRNRKFTVVKFGKNQTCSFFEISKNKLGKYIPNFIMSLLVPV